MIFPSLPVYTTVIAFIAVGFCLHVVATVLYLWTSLIDTTDHTYTHMTDEVPREMFCDYCNVRFMPSSCTATSVTHAYRSSVCWCSECQYLLLSCNCAASCRQIQQTLPCLCQMHARVRSPLCLAQLLHRRAQLLAVLLTPCIIFPLTGVPSLR